MSELMDRIDNHLQAISLEVVTLEGQDIASYEIECVFKPRM